MNENASELAKRASDRFKGITHTPNEIDDLCYPREANLDASNLDELNLAVAKQSQSQSQSLSQSLGASDLTKCDASDLVKSTREACSAKSGGGYHWKTLGLAAGACFRVSSFCRSQSHWGMTAVDGGLTLHALCYIQAWPHRHIGRPQKA
jgi:hypothetical protein